MNRHEDFCSDHECPDCEPAEYARSVQRKKARIRDSLRSFKDYELENELCWREEEKKENQKALLLKEMAKLQVELDELEKG